MMWRAVFAIVWVMLVAGAIVTVAQAAWVVAVFTFKALALIGVLAWILQALRALWSSRPRKAVPPGADWARIHAMEQDLGMELSSRTPVPSRHGKRDQGR